MLGGGEELRELWRGGGEVGELRDGVLEGGLGRGHCGGKVRKSVEGEEGRDGVDAVRKG